MFNQFREESSTQGGRKPRPTFKVRQHLEESIAQELKKLSTYASEEEQRLHELMAHHRPCSQVTRTYQRWCDLIEDFETVEHDYRRCLEPEELTIHDRIIETKRSGFDTVKNTVADYLSDNSSKPQYPTVNARFNDETRRLEEELRQISSRLDQARLSQCGSEDEYGEGSQFELRTVSDAFKHPVRRSTPNPTGPSADPTANYRHPLSERGQRGQRCDRDREDAASNADPTLSTLQKLAELIEGKKEKLPQLEPDVFAGDLLKYPMWIRSFEMLIERNTAVVSERLFYLGKYTDGEAKECIAGFLCLCASDAYLRAKAVLQARYGDKVQVGQAYRAKLQTWKQIKKGDGTALRRLADFLWQCNAAMESVKNLQSLSSAEEICKILKLLPTHMVERWDRVVDRHYYSQVGDPRYSFNTAEGEYPPFIELCKFIAQEARILNGPSRLLRGDASESAPKSDGSQGSKGHSSKKVHALATAAAPTKTDGRSSFFKKREGERRPPSCYFCKQAHVIAKCDAFMNESVEDRKNFATEQHLCFGCLGKSHGYTDCRVKKPWLLKEKGATDKATVCNTRVSNKGEETYYTMAVMVDVIHPTNPDVSVRTCALLDTQADGCFVSNSLAEQLQIDVQPVKLELVTMGSKQLVDSGVVSNLLVRGIDEESSLSLPKVYTQEQIPSTAQSVPRREDIERWSHLSPTLGSLPGAADDVSVGLLIGHNCPALFIPRELAYLDDTKPYGVHTSLGWGILGKRESTPPSKTTCLRTSVREVAMESVYKAFDMGFESEAAGQAKASQEDLLFQTIADRTLIQREDGHFQMDLPFKENPLYMPDNRAVALRQLLGQKKRFCKDPAYLEKYKAFVDNMLEQGHAELVTEPGVEGKINYTPQHGVVHPRKPGKLRVVSNFSSKKDGVSLNQKLLPGPDLTNNLVGVMCRFREEHIAFMCDVKGMFFQVGVSVDHRDYLRFLWFEDGDPNKRVLDYRMCVHPFGATSSPTCANTAFKENASRLEGEFGTDVTSFIKRDFYVDDSLKSKGTVKEVVDLFLKAHQLCLRGGFYLHKFTCNSAEVLKLIPSELIAGNVKEYTLANPTLPTETSLGISWAMEWDSFLFTVQEIASQLTRRGLLSSLCSIYDPIGFIAPVILVGRLILQQLCSDGAEWYDDIPAEYQQRWRDWYDSLSGLAGLRIPRCYMSNVVEEIVSVQFHHFCDASTVGYGVCSYVRLEDTAGHIDVTLICSKARVAPKKATTMPRMELQAAVLSSKMAQFLKDEMPYHDVEVFHWSDSQVVLGYIRNSTKRFHLYVTNRVSTIRDNSEVEAWRYIRSEENPADLTSRGTEVEEILSSQLWWHGPAFLARPNWESNLPGEVRVEPDDADPEVKAEKIIVHATKVQQRESWLQGFEREATWWKAVTHTYLWQRYLRQLQRSLAIKKGHTVPEQLHETVANRGRAEQCLLRGLQQAVFHEEQLTLRQFVDDTQNRDQQRSRKTALKRGSPLLTLDPFIDECGLIRIGGRLKNASLGRSLTQPVVIPSVHHLTALLVMHHHEIAQHPGRQATLAQLRTSGFWVIKGRSTVERYTRFCVVCKRLRGTPIVQKLSDLPESRLQEVPPFSYCGMDLFGPFSVKQKRSLNKRWICVFICFNSLAIHLEVVDELSTDSFLNCFRRFTGRRGPVRTLYSDRGTNFVGAANTLQAALKEMDTERIHREMLRQRCDLVEFRFNSPKSSHMGGLWERAIRTLRSVLSAILLQHSQRMTEESFRTFVVETESIANSKPLTCLDLSDPSADAPITPARLLTMKSDTALPPPGTFHEVDVYGYRRWRQVQALAELFWKQWRAELLPTFQARRKWLQKENGLKVGDVVLLMDESVPRCQWPLATVQELIVSHDQLVRRVLIRCRGSNYERPVCKLIYLGSAER